LLMVFSVPAISKVLSIKQMKSMKKITDRNKNVTKKFWRNIMSASYQKEENFETVGPFTK
jgi:hypothetical protein